MPETRTIDRSADAPERCSHCKAKLPDTPVSLCPYCAMPILGGEQAERAEGKNAARLQKVCESEHFEKAMAQVPVEGPEYQRGGQLVLRGKTLIMVGALLGVGLAIKGSAGAWILVPLLPALIGIYCWTAGSRARRAATAAPLLKRPAVILSRRSEVEIHGWSGETVYYFELELQEGVIAEFRYPGRGSSNEPYTNNMAGVAHTRGDTLLFFQLIRI